MFNSEKMSQESVKFKTTPLAGKGSSEDALKFASILLNVRIRRKCAYILTLLKVGFLVLVVFILR